MVRSELDAVPDTGSPPTGSMVICSAAQRTTWDAARQLGLSKHQQTSHRLLPGLRYAARIPSLRLSSMDTCMLCSLFLTLSSLVQHHQTSQRSPSMAMELQTHVMLMICPSRPCRALFLTEAMTLANRHCSTLCKGLSWPLSPLRVRGSAWNHQKESGEKAPRE